VEARLPVDLHPQSSPNEPQQNAARTARAGDNAVLFAIAAAVALIHILTNSRYGFHRDELQFLSDARHMDWGFVAYPPFTAVVERIGMALFGLNMVGLRLFSVIAQAAAIFVTGLMARELGGSRFAQAVAALTTAFAPLAVFEGTEFQYTTFDYLWWVLIGYFVIRLLKSDNPRWWIAIGVTIGLGLETKYAIVFYIAGILTGLVFSRARRFLLTGWFWAGFAIALAIFLPNFIWLVHHDFISYQFLRHIHIRDVGEGRAEGFWRDQFHICANFAAVPLWIAGLIGFACSRRYRMLAFMAVVPVAIFWASKGRGYYTAGVYPALTAMGAVMAVNLLVKLPRWGRWTVKTAWFAAFAAVSCYVCAIVVPFASSGPLRDFALKNNGDLREEIGWDERVRTVVQIRDSLPPEQRAHLGVVTGNYGEYGAIDILGRAYGLPEPVGTTNSEWLRGYPTQPLTTLIVLGNRPEQVNELFTSCRLAGTNGNSEGVHNEESDDHPWIFVCGPPRMTWQQIWHDNRDFG
jgi:hypothetical protein